MSHVFNFDNCNFYFISIARLFMFKRVWAKTYNSIWNVHIQFYMNKKILTTLGIQEQTHNYFMRKQNEVCQDMTQEWSCVRVILRICEKLEENETRVLWPLFLLYVGFFSWNVHLCPFPAIGHWSEYALNYTFIWLFKNVFKDILSLSFFADLNSCERDHLMLLNLQNINYLVF